MQQDLGRQELLVRAGVEDGPWAGGIRRRLVSTAVSAGGIWILLVLILYLKKRCYVAFWH